MGLNSEVNGSVNNSQCIRAHLNDRWLGTSEKRKSNATKTFMENAIVKSDSVARIHILAPKRADPERIAIDRGTELFSLGKAGAGAIHIKRKLS